MLKDGIQGGCEAKGIMPNIMDFLKTLLTILAMTLSALLESFCIQFHNYLLECLKSVAKVFEDN